MVLRTVVVVLAALDDNRDFNSNVSSRWKQLVEGGLPARLA
jgi:hypothetical protein